MKKTIRTKAVTISALLTFLLACNEVIIALSNQRDNYEGDIAPLLVIIVFPILFLIINKQSKQFIKPVLTKKRIVKLIGGFILLEIILSMIFAGVYSIFNGDMSGNEAFEMLDGSFIFFIALLAWQLLGEETMKISIFLFLYNDFSYKVEKNTRYILAWLVSSLIFGLIHLSTYGFDFVHCLFIIGLPTIIYSIIWAVSERPLYLWLTHFLYDAVLFSLVYFVG